MTKWSYQIRHSEEIAWAVARAFYIAGNGRPGPVVLDIAKDAQTGMTEFDYKPCQFIRSYNPYPDIQPGEIEEAARLINQSRKPFILAGQGVIISHAEKELSELSEKADIPVGCTLLGLSAMPTDHPLYKGMLGMHGSIAANIKTNECDLLIAIGMRFDDRVTGDLKQYARQAKVIHIDIDPSEFNKNVKCDVSVLGDARAVLQKLNEKIAPAEHSEWIESFSVCGKGKGHRTGDTPPETIDEYGRGRPKGIQSHGQRQYSRDRRGTKPNAIGPILPVQKLP